MIQVLGERLKRRWLDSIRNDFVLSEREQPGVDVRDGVKKTVGKSLGGMAPVAPIIHAWVGKGVTVIEAAGELEEEEVVAHTRINTMVCRQQVGTRFQ